MDCVGSVCREVVSGGSGLRFSRLCVVQKQTHYLYGHSGAKGEWGRQHDHVEFKVGDIHFHL